MIKLSKHIYIHPLTIAMFASGYITRTLEIMAGLYAIMLIHELSHMCAAIFLKLGVSKIILYPFGVSLTVKTRILCSLSDKVVLYLSGPVINALIAVIMAVCGKMNDFYYNNLILFIINLLPILPLDGGRLLEDILLFKIGERYARRIMTVLSVVIAFCVSGILILFATPTVNSISFVIFLLGSTILQKPKYNRDYIRQLALTKNSATKAKVIIAEEGTPPQKLVGEFSPSRRTLVVISNDVGEVLKIKTDKEVLSEIFSQ